jgi:hypothetical protein
MVAQVTLQLAQDGGDGERHEGDSALRLESIDRGEQAERRDLSEVLERP